MARLHTSMFRAVVAAVIVLGAVIMVGVERVRADVGIDTPHPGGSINPGEKTDAVRMKDEKVVFTVHDGAGPFADVGIVSEPTKYYAQVTATFTMQNLTDKDVSYNTVFPFHLLYQDEDNPETNIEQARNAKITVNGKEVAAAYDNKTPFGGGFAAAGHFKTTFSAKSDTTIVVSYDLRGIQKPKSPAIAFEYLMQTGAHWAGTIGSGEVRFNFEGHEIDSTAPFTDINSFFKAEDGDLVWRFTNLEPATTDDITVSFDPYERDTVWPARQSFISNLRASVGPRHGGICGNTRTAAPDCNSYLENGETLGTDPGYTKPHVVNLLTVLNATAENGWLIESSQPEKWVEFGFDANYTFSSLRIRTGYLDTNPDYSKGFSEAPGNFYDSFQRPKEVAITYSDGTVQQVTLKDTPADFQDVALLKKATKSLKLQFNSAYAGKEYGNTYFGVGRVQFADAKKVVATEGGSGSTAQQQKDNRPWVLVGAIAGGSTIAAAAGVVVWRVYRQRRLKHQKPVL